MKRLDRVVGLATELGMTMGLTAAGLVILGLVAGRWIDARFGTRPYATLLLIIAGAIAGQIAIFRLAMRSAGRLSADERNALRPQDAVSAIGLALRVLALVALPGLVGLALGLWIDQFVGTSPIATLVLTLGGLFAGLLGSLRLARGAIERPPYQGNDRV